MQGSFVDNRVEYEFAMRVNEGIQAQAFDATFLLRQESSTTVTGIGVYAC